MELDPNPSGENVCTYGTESPIPWDVTSLFEFSGPITYLFYYQINLLWILLYHTLKVSCFSTVLDVHLGVSQIGHSSVKDWLRYPNYLINGITDDGEYSRENYTS
jgi:hypothetical protein